MRNKLITLLNQWADRLTGFASLPSPHRKQVRGAQIQTIADMMPFAIVGTLAMGALTLFVAQSTPAVFSVIYALAVALTVQVIFCGVGSNGQLVKPNREPQPSGARRTNLYIMMALFSGFIWAAALSILITTPAAPMTSFLLGMVVCASVLVSVYIFAQLVTAVLLFVMVTVCALGIALIPNSSGLETAAIVAALFGYATAIPGMVVMNARKFVDRVVGEIRQREASEQLGRRLSDYEDSASDWFWETDADGHIIKASHELLDALRITGAGKLTHLKSLRHILSVAESEAGDLDSFVASVMSNQPFRNVSLCINQTGGPVWIRISGKPVFSHSGKFNGYIGTGADTTAEQMAQSRIVEMAHYDGLTGLLNRSSFASRLESAVRSLERHGTPFMLMFLDLDKFKLVNDTFGHHTGDELLKTVSARISEIVRRGDDIARLGGDEFAIILHKTKDPVFAAKLASRIVEAVSSPYEFATHTATIGASIGVALAPQHGTRPEQLLRNADLALYRAKEDGRGVFRFFESRMDSEEREKRLLEVDMREALQHDQFSMYFQPKICTETGRVVCFEALMRWDHEIRGPVLPDEFIPLAEQSNLIVEIGRWTLRKACECAGGWPDDIAVAVNISATHFMRSDIVEDVEVALAATGLSPDRLEIEITESLMVEDTEDVALRLSKLKGIGVSIALDDFGTGYSSLSYLTKFPFDRLKIDKSFIQDIETDRNAKAIMRAISTLSEDLGISITVEGVETQEQVDFLKTIYCDQFQGFFFSSAVPGDDVAALLLKPVVAELRVPETKTHNKLRVVG